MELAEKRYAQWLAQQGLEPELRQELDAMHSDAEKVTDAFYRDLEFGTAGLRGVLGAGTNRMNIYVIRRATQAVHSISTRRSCRRPSPLAMTAASRATSSPARQPRSSPPTASRRTSIPGSSLSRR